MTDEPQLNDPPMLDPIRRSKLVNYAFALALLADGSYWLIRYGYWSPFKFLVPVYPISLIFIGVALIAYDHKFEVRALPMMLMTLGGLDLVERIPNNLLQLATYDWSVFAQLIALTAGWLYAGKPSFVINKWFWLSASLYALFVTTRLYHLFGLSFYIYIYVSVKSSRKPKSVVTEPTAIMD
jgi:hypothetical protein